MTGCLSSFTSLEFHNVTDLTFPVRLSAVFCDCDLGQHSQISTKCKGEMGGRVWMDDPVAFDPGQGLCCMSGITECHCMHRGSSWLLDGNSTVSTLHDIDFLW